ncbi:MAG: hypothetical protein SGJ13_18290, partial [Actinomycetota bacterium]|nr:hypothetical protein [Actinomycetota bacterium]
MTPPPPEVRDERGSTLIMALGAVTFIAITFSAILGYQTTGLKAQTVLAEKRDAEAAADAGLDFGIAQLQANRTLCTNPSFAALPSWDDPVAEEVVVQCRLESGSSSPRVVVLKATAGGFTATADVTLYDPPDGLAGPSVVSISK